VRDTSARCAINIFTFVHVRESTVGALDLACLFVEVLVHTGYCVTALFVDSGVLLLVFLFF